MFSEIKYVLLDVDNTLLDFDAGAREAAKKAFVKWGLDPARYDHAVFTRINDSLWSALERGELERSEIHRTRWTKIFDALGIDADGELFEAAFLSAIPESVVPVEGALDLLVYLSKKYPLYAASNAPHEQQKKRLKAAGMLDFFSDVFTSERLGAAKPSSAFFDGVFRTLPNVDPSHCVMIGDSLSADIVGAARYGLKTVFFDFMRTMQTSPFADCTVFSLATVQNLL